VIGVEEGRSVQRAGRVGGSSVRRRPGGMRENGVARAKTEQEQEQREREEEEKKKKKKKKKKKTTKRTRTRTRTRTRQRQRRWQRQRDSSRRPFVDDGKAAVSWRWRAGPQAGS
jgi:hypothetical protein